MSPLMLSVNKENDDVLRMLLLAGAAMYLKDNDGATVFDYAAPRRNKGINYLLKTEQEGKPAPELPESMKKKEVEFDH